MCLVLIGVLCTAHCVLRCSFMSLEHAVMFVTHSDGSTWFVFITTTPFNEVAVGVGLVLWKLAIAGATCILYQNIGVGYITA